ncbi:hypothetical protein B1A_04121 [mine drainage metagenome]|uniref:Uncharacterized protein n=1 Tax=mine drainage metagenome TaxID=410659 RepID=T1BQM2_9ZZZZ
MSSLRHPRTTSDEPGDVTRFLLLKNFEGWSYDKTYATLEALPELARKLWFRETVPAASTVAMLVTKVSAHDLEDLLARTTVRLVRGRTNVAGDDTGVATRRFQRWFDVRHGRNGRRRTFVKLTPSWPLGPSGRSSSPPE